MLLLYKPFEDPLVQNLEVMNEVVILTLIGVIFSFEIVAREEDNYTLGYIYISLLFTNVGVHLFFLLLGMVKNFRNAIRKR